MGFLILDLSQKVLDAVFLVWLRLTPTPRIEPGARMSVRSVGGVLCRLGFANTINHWFFGLNVFFTKYMVIIGNYVVFEGFCDV